MIGYDNMRYVRHLLHTPDARTCNIKETYIYVKRPTKETYENKPLSVRGVALVAPKEDTPRYPFFHIDRARQSTHL